MYRLAQSETNEHLCYRASNRLLDNNGDFFSSSVCRTCKRRHGGTARYCSRCKVVSYCCKEHQVEDWKAHRTLCKIIAGEHIYLEYKVSNYAELQTYKQQRGLLWQLQLERKLTRAETQMFMFPRICAVCFKRELLFTCLECQSEFYCSKEHQEQHSNIHAKFCKDLNLSLDIDCYLYYNDLNPGILKVKKLPEGLMLMPQGCEFVKLVLDNSALAADLNYLLCCDQILSGVTLMFALEQAGVLVNRKLPKSSLEIHIVGASVFELSLYWSIIIEIMFHWIKNLEVIGIVFVGPEVENFSAKFEEFRMQFCDTCKARKDLTIKKAEFHGVLYGDSVNDLEKPDAVVVFNSGLHEFQESDQDLWKGSVRSLVQNVEVPLILTAYTYEEIVKDFKRVEEVAEVKVLYGPSKNPFSNQRPLQDWATQNVPVYFNNNYLLVVKA